MKYLRFGLQFKQLPIINNNNLSGRAGKTLFGCRLCSTNQNLSIFLSKLTEINMIPEKHAATTHQHAILVKQLDEKYRSERNFAGQYFTGLIFCWMWSHRNSCSPEDALKQLNKRRYKRKYNEDNISKAYSIVMNNGFSNAEVQRILSILFVHPTTLENRVRIYKESGFKTEHCKKVGTIMRIHTLYNMDVALLKSKGFIPNDLDVHKNYEQIIGLPAQFKPKRTNDDQSLFEIHISMVHATLNWKLYPVWKSVNKDSRLYDVVEFRFRSKSICLLIKTIDLLLNEFELTKEKIAYSIELLCNVPEHLEEILKNTPVLVDCSVQEVAKLWPKILMNNSSALKSISEDLKNFGATREAILMTPAVFTFNPKNVHNRLNVLKNHDVLSQWNYHPKVLRILMYQNKCLDRITKLKELNMKCLSIFTLQSTESDFQRRIELFDDKTYQMDISIFLSKIMLLPKKDIRSRLKKHPYWLYVPHKEVQDTLFYLQEEGFSNEEILKSIILVIYPRNVVAEELSKLHTWPGIECCKDANGKLRRETTLPLLLYKIELAYHFSKEAIWGYKVKDLDDTENNLLT